MHSTETINQFLHLRAQGWTFTRIADHLHVSKPTLIQWSHKHQSELDAVRANQDLSAQDSHKEFPLPIAWGEGQGERSVSWQACDKLRLEHLTLFHTTLRQELIKRTLQNLSDEEVETLATDIEHQIGKLTGQPSVNRSFGQSSTMEEALPNDGKETR